jgi:hypothetical protein
MSIQIVLRAQREDSLIARGHGRMPLTQEPLRLIQQLRGQTFHHVIGLRQRPPFELGEPLLHILG